jgi:hypothetical protein
LAGRRRTIGIKRRHLLSQAPTAKEGVMFDGVFVDPQEWGSDEPPVLETLPWQFVVLLVCFVMLSVAAAIFYSHVFGAPLEQF